MVCMFYNYMEVIRRLHLCNIDVNSSLHRCPSQVYILSQLNSCGVGKGWERSLAISGVGNEEILHRVK